MLKSRLTIVMAEYNLRRAYEGQELINLPKLAALTGLAYTTIQRLDQNSSDRVDLKTLDVLTDFFGVGLEALFEKIPNESKSDDAPAGESVSAIASELIAA